MELSIKVEKESLFIQVKEVNHEESAALIKATFAAWKGPNSLIVKLADGDLAELKETIENSPDFEVNFVNEQEAHVVGKPSVISDNEGLSVDAVVPNKEFFTGYKQETSVTDALKKAKMDSETIEETNIMDLRKLIVNTPWLKIPNYNKMRVKDLRREIIKAAKEHFEYNESSK